jgi:thymidylate kinase
MLEIFNNLFKALHADNVMFCNWKGHYSVESHLGGDGDLDLFVPLMCKAEFEKIAQIEGFRRVISYQADHDFIEHYYGLDKATLKFVHIHVYFKIVTGEHVSKNYILPLEKYILKNLDTSSILPIVNVGGQHNIFLIRYFLKIGSLYGLLQYWREIGKYSSEWNSYNHSHNQEYESVLELDLSSEELHELSKVYESTSLYKKIFLSLKLKKRLKRFRRRSYFQLQIYVIKDFIIRVINRGFLKKQKLLIPGFVIAICGLDGSGKSSLVSALKENYSRHFCVKVLHLGRPASNTLTFFFNQLIAIYSFLKRIKAVSKERYLLKSANNISIIYAIRSVLLAYDRRVETIKAHKFGQNGYLVICDRYPGLGDGKMDSPRIPLNGSRGLLYQFCYNLEQRFYRSIKPANIIFQLSVPLEVAIDRNNKREKVDKETEDELSERFLLNSDATFLGEKCNVIDATVPFREVLLKVTDDIWHSGHGI